MYRLYWNLVVRPSLGKIMALMGVLLVRPLMDVVRIALVVPLMALLVESEDAKAEAAVRMLHNVAEFVGLGTNDSMIITVVAVFFFLTVVLDKGALLLSSVVTVKIQGAIRIRLVARMFDSFMVARYQEILKRGTSGVLQDVQSASRVGSLVSPAADAVSGAILFIMFAGLLMLLSWKATLSAAVILVPTMILSRHFLDKPARELSARTYELGRSRTRHLVDSIVGIKIAKLQGMRKYLVDAVRSIDVANVGVETRGRVLSQLPGALNEVAGLSVILFLLLMTLYVPQFGLSLPIVVALILALRRLSPAITNVGSLLLSLSGAYRQIMVMGEVLYNMEREPDEGLELSSSAKIHVVEFKKVSFTFPERPSNQVLNDISFSLRRGQIVGLVGATGAGKTTLADLLMGLYWPSSGTILVDGIDLSNLKLSIWRNHVGYVSQDAFMFDSTVGENIALWRENITFDQVEQAAMSAQVHNFIMSLPQGYDTKVGGGGMKLSGGQRQRIAIARAIVHQPQVFVFDEATSSLDNLTEVEVQRAINNLKSNSLTLVIAHRLSTLRDVDKIVVIDAGKIVESGRHEALLTADGVYAHLYRSREEEPESEPSISS